eukprot:scaffold11999_cov88-Phaeocystis_antarctica.AAC.4
MDESARTLWPFPRRPLALQVSTKAPLCDITSFTIYGRCALATPRNRGRTHRRLGRLSGRGTEAEEAAAVAALVGGSDPDAASNAPRSSFAACPPAGCTPRTSPTTRLRHRQGRRFARARCRRRWGK